MRSESLVLPAFQLQTPQPFHRQTCNAIIPSAGEPLVKMDPWYKGFNGVIEEEVQVTRAVSPQHLSHARDHNVSIC